MDWVAAVREFHEKFSVPCADAPTPGDLDRRDLRFALIEEEVKEFADACCEHDVIEMADALADKSFTSPIGAAVEFGIPIDRVFAEVHRSNMTKLWPDGKPRYRDDGKVLKPDTYSPANIRGALGL